MQKRPRQFPNLLILDCFVQGPRGACDDAAPDQSPRGEGYGGFLDRITAMAVTVFAW
jgi:hypothetical protein